MNNFLDKYKECTLCARACKVNRALGEIGYCRSSTDVSVARAALHHWEEPIISGTRGSGTIFFCGCSLGCVYCQNSEISRGKSGKTVSVDRLSGIMNELQAKGAHNINLVTPTHYAPSIVEAVGKAREDGLSIPIAYNTSSYDSPETIEVLNGSVDIYLADLKYHLSSTAKKYSAAENYPEAAKAAIEKMVLQRGSVRLENGLLSSGVIVRILLLPGHLAEAKLCCSYLLDKYGDDIYVSLMSQYTPMPDMEAPLNRRVTAREYGELCEYALKKGLKNGFMQEKCSAEQTFIPSFDCTGV